MSFPHYLQHDAMDCGPTCLLMITSFYGRRVSIGKLRQMCYSMREGTSLLGIGEAAEKLGFHTIGVKLIWEQLRERATLPCIVHWNQNHFVVVYKIKKRNGRWYVYVSDPAVGHLRYSKDRFLKSWLEIREASGKSDRGVALLLEPTPSLYEQQENDDSDDKKYTLSYITKYLIPHRQSLVQIVMALIVACLLSLILPFITQSVIDRGVTFGDLSLVKIMLAAQLFICAGQLANNLIRSWLMLHMTARVSITLISDFLAKLMRLPIAFFDTKMTGDIMQRIQDHSRIQDFLTNSLISILSAFVLFVIYGAILGGYNPMILVIFLLGTFLYVVWVLLFIKWRRKLDYMRFQEAANNQNSIIQLIGGMQDIKLNNCEKQKRWEWEQVQAKLFRISVSGLTLSQAQQVGGAFIDQTKNIIISYLSAKSVIDGSMTLGMMTALTYIIGQLNVPIGQFISFVKEYQDASISLGRLGEINNRDDEEPSGKEKISDIPDDADVEFKSVSFQYEGPHSPKVLDEITLKVPHGKVTAIVGTSGSGKTTILKMMLGFYAPIKGSITLGGCDIYSYSASAWRGKCGCVMQEGYIFSNTIAENIALCDGMPDMKRVRRAAELANIKDWIENLPLGYNTKIGADGHGVSTGQKQRILIARAAYKNSPYIFFDEATNSLDANNEKVIMENLKGLFEGKTVVVIAHRLSTVKNADNILVIDSGRIIEEGTHLELIARKGRYYELVRNQLELGN